EAGGKIEVGTQLSAGKTIALAGGADASGKSVVLQGSASLTTWAANSTISLGGTGEVDVDAPHYTQELAAAGSIATANGVLASDVTLDVTVNRGTFTSHGAVPILAAATTGNTSIFDLIGEIQDALNNFTGYTVTQSSDTAHHPVGSTFTQDSASPDLVAA